MVKIVRFSGGLGNQLFQYAFFESLKKYDDNVLADVSLYTTELYHQGFELEKIFELTLPKATKKDIKKLGYYEPRKIHKLLRKLYLQKRTHYIEETIGYDKNIKINGDLYYEGYWQSEEYFKEINDIIQEKLKFPLIVDGKNKSCYLDICKKNSVAIHIRRKDFLSSRNSHFINLSATDYYRRAICNIKKRMGSDIYFFIFSDDMEWVKQELLLENCVYVDWNDGDKSYLDMQLMSHCKGIIMANSTFSWWGAYLNPLNIDKTVISPKKWYNVDCVSGRKVIHGSINLDNWLVI